MIKQKIGNFVNRLRKKSRISINDETKKVTNFVKNSRIDHGKTLQILSLGLKKNQFCESISKNKINYEFKTTKNFEEYANFVKSS